MQLSSRRLAGAFALPALLALFHAPLLFGPQAVWYAGDDNAYQVLPWLELQAREWRAGRVPLWDPYSWMGQPLAGQMQPAVTAPLHWVLLPLKPAEGLTPLFFNLYFLTIRWIAAAAMYRLARSLGCGRVAGIAAGFAFATVGWFAFQTRPQMAMSAMWAPLALLYLLKGARGDGSLRHAVLGGFFLGLCWLGGHHQAPLFLSTGAAFAWLALLIRNWRCWRAAAAFFLTTAAASALVLLPAMEYGRRAVRWAGTPEPLGWKEKIPYEIHRQYSLNPDAIPSIFWPGYRGKLEPFSGIVLIIAALFALLRWRRRPEALLLGGLGLSGLLLSLGPAGALHPLLYRLLPHFDKARAPEAALVLLAASLPALAALGLEGLAEGSRRAARLSAAAAFLAFAGLTAAAAARASLPADPRWTSAAAAACLAIALLAATRFRLPAPLLAAAAVAMLWIEARPLYRHVLAPVQDAQAMKAVNCLQAHTDIARFLRSQGGCWRIEVDDADVPCNFGDWHALPQTHGYLASATENIYRHELHTEWAKRLFGVRYRVAKTPSPTHAHPVFEGASGVRVWERRDVLPRVFTVHEAEPLPDRRQAAGWLYLIRGRLAEKTFLPGSVPAMERCAGPDSVRLVEYSPLHARIEAAMACRGMLILTDTWYPGWRAAIDGREVPIHEAYAAVRGVVVEAGLHTVDFRYRPASILWGAAWTGAAFGLAAFCARRRRLHW
ncbi:MAG: YfhO family protein [Bryobacteraceae bacterium]|nr:YfhO family protein [Bryobacteraceae bacterium]